ncbi:GlsB/YeaQ/YmgE family stress response membrane protein [Micrococcus antarcticus]
MRAHRCKNYCAPFPAFPRQSAPARQSIPVLGDVGAVAAGWICSAVFGEGVDQFWSLSSWLLAISGSLIVLVIWGVLTRKHA